MSKSRCFQERDRAQSRVHKWLKYEKCRLKARRRSSTATNRTNGGESMDMPRKRKWPGQYETTAKRCCTHTRGPKHQKMEDSALDWNQTRSQNTRNCMQRHCDPLPRENDGAIPSEAGAGAPEKKRPSERQTDTPAGPARQNTKRQRSPGAAKEPKPRCNFCKGRVNKYKHLMPVLFIPSRRSPGRFIDSSYRVERTYTQRVIK